MSQLNPQITTAREFATRFYSNATIITEGNGFVVGEFDYGSLLASQLIQAIGREMNEANRDTLAAQILQRWHAMLDVFLGGVNVNVPTPRGLFLIAQTQFGFLVDAILVGRMDLGGIVQDYEPNPQGEMVAVGMGKLDEATSTNHIGHSNGGTFVRNLDGLKALFITARNIALASAQRMTFILPELHTGNLHICIPQATDTATAQVPDVEYVEDGARALELIHIPPIEKPPASAEPPPEEP